MNRLWLTLLLAFCQTDMTLAAEDDLRDLVKALSNQVQQLSNRVADLESQLAREKQSNSKGEELPSAAPVVSAENPASSPEGKARKPKLSRWSTPHANPPGDATGSPEPPPVTSGDFKGSIKIPGIPTSVAIGGYAKLDAIYSSVGSGNNNYGNQFLVLSNVPVGLARYGQNSQTTFHVKESRIWLKSFTPSAYGDINSYIELDLYGSPDAYTPRLRHAYGSIGHFLAGQTWTTFLNVAAIPETLDIGGSVGLGLVRQPMIRWTQPFSMGGAALELQAALESPNTRLALEYSATIVSPNDDRYPDFISRLNWHPAWGELSLSAGARQIRYAPPVGPALAHWGGAASLGGKIKTSGQDNLRFTLSYGNAFGRYASLYTFADAALDNAGRSLILADNFSAMLSYQHWWSSLWRSTLAYGYAQSDLAYFANGGLTRQGQSAHLNLLWSPVAQATFGLEYIYATRSLQSGPYGDLNRVQFSSRFNF